MNNIPRTKLYQTERGGVHGFEARLDQLEGWAPVITQVREAILRGYVTGSHMLDRILPPDVMRLAPSQREVEAMAESAEAAVRAGRLIDFGDWTNDVIKHGGQRGGPLYSRGAIGHPFALPWVFRHTWEHSTAAYLVNPLDRDKLAGGDCECVELQPMKVAGNHMLMIADRMMLTPDPGDTTVKYHCSAIPSVWRYLPDVDEAGGNNGLSPAQAAAGNVLDPLMTALLILSTRGIARETVTVPDKLQKARAKNGKPPIPPYDRVFSAPYVTAIQARRARGRAEPKGGTHASPVPHLRMGHPRTYASGVQVFVRDALVNMSDDARRAWITGRSHYAVKS